MSLREAIMKIGLGVVQASDPVAVMYGTVVQVDPLEIQVDQRLTLPAAVLLVPESLVGYTVDLGHTHNLSGSTTGTALTQPVVIRRPLEEGDNVLLLRLQGGQLYVILDRVMPS
jgi:hypothetical protein